MNLNFINNLKQLKGDEIISSLIPCLLLIYVITLSIEIKLMKNRKAFNVRGILITFNVVVIILSLMLLMRVSQLNIFMVFYDISDSLIIRVGKNYKLFIFRTFPTTLWFLLTSTVS